MDGKTSRLKADRDEQLAFLVSICHRLMLEPQDGNVRQFVALMLAQAEVRVLAGDTPLAAALVKEVQGSLDEMAYRLEAPGYSPLYVGAVAARLCQTLTALQTHLVGAGPQPGRAAAAGRAMQAG
jgi:hypothetical protein